MYQAEVVYDETNSTLRWLRVSHNGASWSSIQVRSNEEALQIISALQQSVQSDRANAPRIVKVLNQETGLLEDMAIP